MTYSPILLNARENRMESKVIVIPALKPLFPLMKIPVVAKSLDIRWLDMKVNHIHNYQNFDYIFMVNDRKLRLSILCRKSKKNNMNTNYIQGVTEMQVKNWTMPIKTKNLFCFFLQEWQKASNRLIFEIIGLKQGD